MGNKFKANIVAYKVFLPDTNAAYVQCCKWKFFFSICSHLSLINQGHLYNMTIFMCTKEIFIGNIKLQLFLKDFVEFKRKKK